MNKILPILFAGAAFIFPLHATTVVTTPDKVETVNPGTTSPNDRDYKIQNDRVMPKLLAVDETVVMPQKDSTIVVPNKEGTVVVPDKNTTVVSPNKGSAVVPSQDVHHAGDKSFKNSSY